MHASVVTNWFFYWSEFLVLNIVVVINVNLFLSSIVFFFSDILSARRPTIIDF